MDADPLFQGGNDYHLRADSPCIDTGTSTGAPDHDIDDEPRPWGQDVDIGSDEFHSTFMAGGEERMTDRRERSSRYLLCQNHPNPFNPETSIEYYLPEEAHVSLTIFDARGNGIRTLSDAIEGAGDHAATWDGKNESGHAVSTGVYFYRIRMGDYAESRRMMLIK